MRWRWLAVAGGVVLASACAGPVEARLERRAPLGDVRDLSVHGPASVTLVTARGLDPVLRLEGAPHDVDAVRWSLSNGALHLEVPESVAEGSVQVEVVAPSLRALVAEERALVTGRRLVGGRVALEARRGARLVVGQLDADTVRLEARTDGVVDVAGRARVLEARADDVGTVEAMGLGTSVTRLEASGLSTIRLGPTSVLRASVRRASRLTLVAPAPQQLVMVDETSTLETRAPLPRPWGPASANALPR